MPPLSIDDDWAKRYYAAKLPVEMRQQIVRDVPHWSDHIQRKAIKYGDLYVDIAAGLRSRLAEAEAVLNG